MHLARHTFATELRRIDQTDLETATPTRAGSNSNGRTKSFPPKLTAESARLRQKVEAAGIEPASADAPD
jgi:hypothetical protein